MKIESVMVTSKSDEPYKLHINLPQPAVVPESNDQVGLLKSLAFTFEILIFLALLEVINPVNEPGGA